MKDRRRTERPRLGTLRKRRAGTRWFILIELLCGLLIGICIFDRVLMPLAVRHGEDAIVPELKNRPKDEGERAIAGSNLRIGQAIEVPDANTPNGAVISQDPAAGARVRKGRHVNLIVSQGAPLRLVPDLAGKTSRGAQIELGQLDLRAGASLTVPSLTVAGGEIIGTRPARGESPGHSGTVDLLISAGPEKALYLMPDLRGLDVDEATARLRAAGINVESGAGSNVHSQDPKPGEPIWTGDVARID